MSVLKVSNLSIGYGKLVVKKDINLEAGNGQIISILGRNGTGKTTFMKTIAGLLSANNGDVFIRNEKLQGITREQMARHMAVVLTEKPSTLNLTVKELIALGRHPYSSWLGKLDAKSVEIVDKVISDVGLKDISSYKLFELSDGQLQLAMIGRALAQDTDIILMDEPTAHLDLPNKIEVIRLIKLIASEGKTIVISSHDIRLCIQISSRIWLFGFDRPVLDVFGEDLMLSDKLHDYLEIADQDFDFEYGTLTETANGPIISLAGDDGSKFYWTKQALLRHNYQISVRSKINIQVNQDHWELVSEDFKGIFYSLEELFDKLKELDQSSTIESDK